MGTATVDSLWMVIHEYLDKEMRRVHDEIRNYPAPIPACDAQFNYLLEERDALSSELARVREHMNESGDTENALSSIDAFLNISNALGEAKKREIRALIDNRNR